MSAFRFHQFVWIERGPTKSLLMDLLSGDAFHVDNNTLDAFEERDYERIGDFLTLAGQGGLVIETEDSHWIPGLPSRVSELEDEQIWNLPISLEIEDDRMLSSLVDWLGDVTLSSVTLYYRGDPPENFDPRVTKTSLKDGACMNMACSGVFPQINEEMLNFRRLLNSCWGCKVAVTEDSMVRPCIYSTASCGDYRHDASPIIKDRLLYYWKLSRKKIPGCASCELRHVCLDCREAAYRLTTDILAPTPGCVYANQGKSS